MDNEKLRFGILGCGLAARFHAAAIRSIPGAETVGVFDGDAERARAFCEEFGGSVYESAEAFFASPEIDAVCVCTPSGYHAENAIAALRGGKHVLIEKPVATDLASAKAILDEARGSGRTVGVVAQLRPCGAVQRIRKALEEEQLGRIVSVQLEMLYHRSEEYYKCSAWHGTRAVDGGGALINQGIHGIDLLLYLLGRVKNVTALTRTLYHHIETEDTAAALLEYENGAIGTIGAATSIYPGSPRRLKICGTKGTITLTEDHITKYYIEGKGSLIGEKEQSDYLSHNDPGAIPADAHIGVIRDFCAAVREGRSPISDLTDGYNALALIRAIYDSAERGERVEPEYIDMS
ncbi:MAG: Gfo/Idh/MocA family oxidoreductase [Clostridia bacterium]|nr:Gfo/Idh/MocA family oxidoreductase [Clostridia bacterium]